MGLKAKIRYPGIDKKATIDAIDNDMSKFVMEACTTWVIETTDNVPVWSGASKASFLKLADLVQVSLVIEPVAPTPPGSRIPLGIQTSVGQLFRQRGVIYGWEWQSNLDYIHIVDRHHSFIAAGNATLNKANPKLPQPVIKTGS